MRLFDLPEITEFLTRDPRLIFELQYIYNEVRKEFPSETLQLFTIEDTQQLGLTIYTTEYSVHAFPKFNRLQSKLGHYAHYPLFNAQLIKFNPNTYKLYKKEPFSKRKVNIYLSFLKKNLTQAPPVC